MGRRLNEKNTKGNTNKEMLGTGKVYVGNGGWNLIFTLKNQSQTTTEEKGTLYGQKDQGGKKS